MTVSLNLNKAFSAAKFRSNRQQVDFLILKQIEFCKREAFSFHLATLTFLPAVACSPLSIWTDEVCLTSGETIFSLARAKLPVKRQASYCSPMILALEIRGANANVDQVHCQLHMLSVLKDSPWTTGGVLSQVRTRSVTLDLETKPGCEI